MFSSILYRHFVILHKIIIKDWLNVHALKDNLSSFLQLLVSKIVVWILQIQNALALAALVLTFFQWDANLTVVKCMIQ